MYSVKIENSEIYGEVISIQASEDGRYLFPQDAVIMARGLKNQYKDSNKKNILYLVDGQVMKLSSLEKWAAEEYSSLPKCYSCNFPLNEKIHVDRDSNKFFCSETCHDLYLLKEHEEFLDEEEIDYL